jgi:hypothetical protein
MCHGRAAECDQCAINKQRRGLRGFTRWAKHHAINGHRTDNEQGKCDQGTRSRA